MGEAEIAKIICHYPAGPSPVNSCCPADDRTCEKKARAVLAAMRKGEVPQYVWIVQNDTFTSAFATKEAANNFAASYPASIAGEMSVTKSPVLAASIRSLKEAET